MSRGTRFLPFALSCVVGAACGRRPPDPVPDAAPVAASVPVPTPVPVPVVTPAAQQPASTRPRLHLTLRSTPPGAAVNVDGRLVGSTPARLEMDDDARPHDFAFVLRGYAPWKLKFSPSRDGVVHATLDEILVADAGMP